MRDLLARVVDDARVLGDGRGRVHAPARDPRLPALNHRRIKIHDPLIVSGDRSSDAAVRGGVAALDRLGRASPTETLISSAARPSAIVPDARRWVRRFHGRDCAVLGPNSGGLHASLSIEITRECPLRCPGCYAYGSEHLGGALTLREVQRLQGTGAHRWRHRPGARSTVRCTCRSSAASRSCGSASSTFCCRACRRWACTCRS